MSTTTSSCGQACSSGRRCPSGWQRGPDNTVPTYMWRPSPSVTPTLGGPLPMRGSSTHWTRLGPAPSPSRRRSLLRVHARSTSGSKRWKSWRGCCRSGRSWTTSPSGESSRPGAPARPASTVARLTLSENRRLWRMSVPRSWPVSSTWMPGILG
jgi:hypothetical protein